MSLFKSISSFTKEDSKALLKAARIKIIASGLTIKIAPKKESLGRILIVIPKKTGNAPQRNLLRRRLKTIFFEEKLYNEPFDCIVFATEQAVEVPFSHLKKLIITALGHENNQ